MYPRPFPEVVNRFYATASHTTHELPIHLQKGHWKAWMLGPDEVAKILKVCISEYFLVCFFLTALPSERYFYFEGSQVP